MCSVYRTTTFPSSQSGSSSSNSTRNCSGLTVSFDIRINPSLSKPICNLTNVASFLLILLLLFTKKSSCEAHTEEFDVLYRVTYPKEPLSSVRGCMAQQIEIVYSTYHLCLQEDFGPNFFL